MGIAVGNQYAVGVIFTDENDAATDPTAVTFKFKTPAGTITTYTHGVDAELIKDSTGKYHVVLTASLPGIYYWRFAGTGTVVAALEDSFVVDPTILG